MIKSILLLVLTFKCSFSFGYPPGIVGNTIREVKRMIDTARYISLNHGDNNVYVLKVRAADSVNYCMSVWYILTQEELNLLPVKESILVLNGQFVVLDVPEFLRSKIALEYHVASLDNLKESLSKKLSPRDVLVMREHWSSTLVSCYNSEKYLTKYFQHGEDVPDGISPYNFQEKLKDRFTKPPRMDTLPIINHK